MFPSKVATIKGAAIFYHLHLEIFHRLPMEKILAQMLNISPDEIKSIKSKIDENSNETIYQITHGEVTTNLKLSEVTNYVRNRLNRIS